MTTHVAPECPPLSPEFQDVLFWTFLVCVALLGVVIAWASWYVRTHDRDGGRK